MPIVLTSKCRTYDECATKEYGHKHLGGCAIHVHAIPAEETTETQNDQTDTANDSEEHGFNYPVIAVGCKTLIFILH